LIKCLSSDKVPRRNVLHNTDHGDMNSAHGSVGSTPWRPTMKSCLGRCLYLCCVLLFSSASFAQVSAPPQLSAETPTRQIREAPVVYLGESLFTLHQKVGSFTPQQRAQAIQARLEQVSDATPSVTSTRSPSLKPSTAPTSRSTGLVLLTVTDGDAKPLGRNRQDLAREYAGKLRTCCTRLKRAERGTAADGGPRWRLQPPLCSLRSC
jgi:hypothetical protein